MQRVIVSSVEHGSFLYLKQDNTTAHITESRGSKLKLMFSCSLKMDVQISAWIPAAHENFLATVYLSFFKPLPWWMTWRKEMKRERPSMKHGPDFLGH